MSGSDAGYTMLRGSVKGTGYTLHSPVSPSLSLPCVTVCHHISTGLYRRLAGCTPEPPGRLLVRPPHNMIPIVTAPCRLRIRLFYLQLLYSTQTVSCTIPAPVSCHLHHFSAECQHRVGDLQANKWPCCIHILLFADYLTCCENRHKEFLDCFYPLEVSLATMISNSDSPPDVFEFDTCLEFQLSWLGVSVDLLSRPDTFRNSASVSVRAHSGIVRMCKFGYIPG